MQKQFIKGLVTKSEDGQTYKVLASTSAIDRQGDSIDQSGWDITNFKLNPVMPWAHDYNELPIGKVTNIQVTKRGLEAEFVFAPAEGNPKAQQIRKLYDEGFLNAVSVGFIPKERRGNTITKAELLEISMVPVPANQEALRLAFETKSIDFSLIPEMKGAVEDEINAEEVYEQKWQKWNEFCDILSAFWTVYFNEETPVDDFGKLLGESIVLMQELVGTPATADEGGAEEDNGDTAAKGLIKAAISPENLKGFMEAFVVKSGRVLSKKTLEKIDEAITSLKGSTSVLEELKAASSDDQDGQDDTSQVEEKGAEEETIDVPVIEEKIISLNATDLILYRQKLVANDKQNEHVLSLVNAKMRELGIK